LYQDKETQQGAFKSLLEENNITSTTTFANAVRMCEGDVRWHALKKAGERKQLYSEYCTARGREEKEEEARGKKLAKEAFLRMLEEHKEVDEGSQLDDFEPRFRNDPRYIALKDVNERAYLFQQHCSDLSGKAKRARAKKKADAQVGFLEYLQVSHTRKSTKRRCEQQTPERTTNARARSPALRSRQHLLTP